MCLAKLAKLAKLANFHIAFSLQTLAFNGAIVHFEVMAHGLVNEVKTRLSRIPI